MTDDTATIRDALDRFVYDTSKREWLTHARAALARVEARLAAPCHCDKCLDCLAADGYEAAIERAEQAERERDEYRIEADLGHGDYEDAEDIIRQIAEKRPNRPFDPWAADLCQAFVDRPNRSRTTIAGVRAEADRLRGALRPFAEGAEAFDRADSTYGEEPFFIRTSGDIVWQATIADVRRARGAIAGPQTKEQT